MGRRGDAGGHSWRQWTTALYQRRCGERPGRTRCGPPATAAPTPGAPAVAAPGAAMTSMTSLHGEVDFPQAYLRVQRSANVLFVIGVLSLIVHGIPASVLLVMAS